MSIVGTIIEKQCSIMKPSSAVPRDFPRAWGIEERV